MKSYKVVVIIHIIPIRSLSKKEGPKKIATKTKKKKKKNNCPSWWRLKMTCGVEGKTIDKNWDEETKKKGAK